MRKAITLFILLAYNLTRIVNAQNSVTDSLIRIINTAPDDTNKVHLYWKTAVSIIYQDPLKAIPYFKQGTALALKLGFISGIEKCYNGTSLAFSYNAKYDSALTYINYAVHYAIKAGNIKRLALAYLNRADVYNNLQNYSAALKNCDTAIVYADQIKNNDGLGRIYTIMSDIYVSLKQYPKAFACLDKSDKCFEQLNNKQMVAINYSERAELFLDINEPAKAIPYLKKAIDIGDSLQDIDNLSAYNSALAQAYTSLKKYKEAEVVAMLALKYSKQTGNTLQQAVIYDNLCNQLIAQKNFEKAIEYGLKAHSAFKEGKDLMREQGAANNLAEAYHQTGNIKQAYHYLQISSALNDSLVKQQFNNETAKLQTTFEVKQKDKEIELLNKNKELQQQKLQKQRLLLIGALLLAALAITGIWLLMNRNKLRQRMKEMELRNQIAADLHDEVGSSLSSIHMLSQMATQQGSETLNKDILIRMSGNAQETMDKMGDIVWMIKPGETEAGSLKQRMERFAYEICSGKNISVTLQLGELEKMKFSMEQRKNIYLIFKEALNNAVKYSGTEKMEVTTNMQNRELVLYVRDFGKGFDNNLVKKGNGLQNMQNRAKELRGILSVETDINKGTTIQLVVPV